MVEEGEGEPRANTPSELEELLPVLRPPEPEEAKRFVPLSEALEIVDEEARGLVGGSDLTPAQQVERDAREFGTPQADLRRRVRQGLRLVKMYHEDERHIYYHYPEDLTEMERAMKRLSDEGGGPQSRFWRICGPEAFRHARQGLLYMKAGNYLKAIDEISEAIKLQPEDLGLYINRGVAYRMMGDRERALADFQRVLDETTPWDARYRSLVYENLGRMGIEVENKEKKTFLALAETAEPEAGASQPRGTSLAVREAGEEDESDQRPLSLKDAYEMIDVAVRRCIEWLAVPGEWHIELAQRLKGTPKGRFRTKFRRAAWFAVEAGRGTSEFKDALRQATRGTSASPKLPFWRRRLFS